MADGKQPAVILESTGQYHMPVIQFLEEQQYVYIIVNPLISHRARSTNLRKVKTDAIDAYHLCELYYKEELEPYKSDKRLERPIKIYGYVNDVVKAFASAVDDIVERMGEQANIMVVGRNNIDLKFMLQRDMQGRLLHFQKGVVAQAFEYITVHRSKGLEKDNVIVINLRNHLIGFPNKISDDPLLSLVLTDADQFMYAEERRLFYVAITRTKNMTYLIAPEKDTSIFVEELIKEQTIPFEVVTNEHTVRTNPNCDVCQTGVLTIRQSNDGRSFLGCSNYPSCNKTYKELDAQQKKTQLHRKSKIQGLSDIPLSSRILYLTKLHFDYKPYNSEDSVIKWLLGKSQKYYLTYLYIFIEGDF